MHLQVNQHNFSKGRSEGDPDPHDQPLLCDGTQPFFLVSDGTLDEVGEMDLMQVQFPASMDIKKSVVGLMQSAVLPNWHRSCGPWTDAVKAKKYAKRHPEERWPAPIEEDDQETQSEESDAEGE